MASRHYSDRALGYQKPKAVAGMGGLVCDVATYNFSVVSIINDTYYMFWIPRGCHLVYWYISTTTGIDSSTGAKVSVGDLASSARYFAAENFGQSSGADFAGLFTTGNASSVLPYTYSLTQVASLFDSNGATPSPAFVDAFIVKVTTAPTGSLPTSAQMQACIMYTLDPGTENQ